MRTANNFQGFDVAWLTTVGDDQIERAATLLKRPNGWKLEASNPPREVFFSELKLEALEALFTDGKCLPIKPGCGGFTLVM